MLPTVADGGLESSSSAVVSFRRVPAVVSQLDEVLFASGGWFALSAGNERVPGVVVASLGAGLGLVGQGPVASLVGRLQPGFRVVDVDVEGLRGHAIAEEVAGWARGRGLWVLVRPSGGADGRTHVFVAVADHLNDLEEFVGEVRAAYGVGRSRVDVRVMVRPLSAPHRSGVETRPLGSVSAALADLLVEIFERGRAPERHVNDRQPLGPGVGRRPVPPVDAPVEVPAVTGGDGGLAQCWWMWMIPSP